MKFKALPSLLAGLLLSSGLGSMAAAQDAGYYAQQTYISSGATSYAIPFPYLFEADIQVFVNGTPLVLGTGFTFSGAGTVQLASAPAVGATVELLRRTHIVTPEATFEGGALASADLNSNAQQAIYGLQEDHDITQAYQLVATQFQLPSIAALRSLSLLNDATATTYSVQQYCTAGQGTCTATNNKGGGIFNFNPSDTTTADNGCTIFVDTADRRWYRLYSGLLNAQACGAQGDGSTDDTTAIQAALALGGVYLPGTSAYYKVSATLTMSRTGQQLRGESEYSTTIKSTSASAPLILFSTTSPITGLTVANMTLDRSVVATAGGNGIDSSAGDTEQALLENLQVEHQWNGLALGPTSNSFIHNVISGSNYNNGISLVGLSTNGTMQWSVLESYVAENGTSSAPQGDGIYIAATSGSGVSTGTFTQINTFGNYKHGIDIEGAGPTYAVNDFRLEGGFIGQDGQDGIYLNSYSGAQLRPTMVELSGMGQGASCGANCAGVGLAYAASLTGSNINITANNTGVNVAVQTVNGAAYDGLFIANVGTQAHTTVAGGVFSNNGLAMVSGRENGIFIYNASSGVQAVAISGVSSYGNAYGILTGGTSTVSVTGSDLTGNTTALSNSGSSTLACFAGNMPKSANAC